MRKLYVVKVIFLVATIVKGRRNHCVCVPCSCRGWRETQYSNDDVVTTCEKRCLFDDGGLEIRPTLFLLQPMLPPPLNVYVKSAV